MTYTPKGTYFDEKLSAADKAAIDAYKSQWEQAHKNNDADAMAAAHAGAEAIRAAAGYSGGADGSDYIPVPRAGDALAETLRRTTSSAAARARERERRALAASVEQAVNALESSRAETEQRYSDLFRQLYLDKMRGQKNMDQRFAASGVTGGAAETVRLGYDTAYADALRQGEQSRIDALGSIDRAVADARLTGDVEAAKAEAKALREDADAYADTLRYLINREDARAARREQYAREDAESARKYLAEQQEAARREAEAARRETEAREKAEAEASKPALTPAQVLAAIKSGVVTDAVRAAYRYYYGTAYRG